MPELPEVETVVRSLKKVFAKHIISDIRFLRKDLRFPMPQGKIKKILLHQESLKAWRRGKYIVIESREGSALVHLGMSGQMVLVSKTEPLAKHTHVILSLDSDKSLELRYIDPRRFGVFDAITGVPAESHKLLEKLGYEPLSTKNLADKLYEAAKTRSVSIKSFLMNSHIVVGVGNIYACEALYKAKIHPETSARLLDKTDFKRLIFEVCEVLKQAIKQGGTTLKDFRSLKNEKGYFQVKLLVYGREGESCLQCKYPIERFQQNGRSTWVCSSCQK